MTLSKPIIEEAPVYINKVWESSCKIMLGGSIGSIEKYEEYMWKNIERYRTEKSAISGKQVAVTGEYSKNARFISGEEIEQYSKIIGKEKLNINEIKDIDSILNALGERIYYSGNDTLGNSGMVSESNRVVESTYIHKAHDIFYSKYIAYTYLSKYSDHIFGCESVGFGTHFAIKSFETYEDSRLFECVRCYQSADLTYCSNLANCQSCMFSFNLRSKRRCIGNIELPEDKFAQLRNKLLEEIRQTLESKRTAPSIMEIVGE